MSQSRRERGLPEGVSPFDATRLEHYQRDRHDIPREESIEDVKTETAKFYASYTGAEDTLRDVGSSDV